MISIHLKTIAILMLASVATAGVAQTTTTSTANSVKAHRAVKRKASSIETQLRQMREQFAEQQQRFQQQQGEIDQLKQELQSREQQLQQAQDTAQQSRQTAVQAQAQAASATQNSSRSSAAYTNLKQAVRNIQTESATSQQTLSMVEQDQEQIKKSVLHPDEIHYKGVTIKPGGFIAAETVWRQKALNADIFTPWNAQPYPDSGEAHTSEFLATARQSRLSALVSGKVPGGTLNGYVEADFLSAGTTSNSLQSNSYTLRIRQAWAQAAMGRNIFTGGQMWSLLTEDKKGASPAQEAFPLLFDGNYHVGFTYARQAGFRYQHIFSPSFTLAASLENSQYQFSASNAPTNFFFGAPGASGGLNNPSANYTNQVAPDLLVKAAFDPGYGHYEVGGILRFFRDRYYPNAPSSTGAENNTKTGGGFSLSARFPVTRKTSFGAHLIAGDGTGRYGASLLPDITVHPDGTLEPLRNAQGLISLELHPSRRFVLFGYAGTEYAQRTYYVAPDGKLVGYAPPSASNAGCFVEAAPSAGSGYAPGAGSCLGATRALTQGSIGWLYRFYHGPHGTLQYGAAYSYIVRNAWTGVGGAPEAPNNFVYTSFRYYIP